MPRPGDIAEQIRGRRDQRRLDDGSSAMCLPCRSMQRARRRGYLDRFPVGGYSTTVENWRALDDRRIEFTMRRLPTAD